MAAFGTPWPEPRSLTISFPGDGTGVGQYTSDLQQTLDAVTGRSNWQELALRAFQTWAIHADINVGLRNDYGNDFGAAGLTQSDPRFGDFRIGAYPQVGVLANSVPFQAVAGTFSGDILLNSSQTFTYHDWAGGIGPDPATQVPGQWDLFSLLLHESGNALGLDDSTLDWTVMFGQYTEPKGALSQDDIDRIQALYGPRSDPYEPFSNDQIHMATLIPTPGGFQPASDVISMRGSLKEAADVDYYEIVPLAGQNEVTLRLRADGISLVKSRLEVLDVNGQVVASADANSVFDNDNVIQINNLQNHSFLYLRVSALDPNDYSVGDYQLEVDYRAAAVQASDPVAGGHDSGVDTLFTNFALADAEQGTDDTIQTANDVDVVAGLGSHTRYEFTSAVSAAADVDYWKLSAPTTVEGRLVVNLAGVGASPPHFAVRIVDSAGQPVGAGGRLNADGSWTLEVAQPVSNQDYFLRVSVDPNSAVEVGNYVATAEFVSASAQMNQLVLGDVSS
ncbi:MAG: matrixin family metalloprotease, partial [Pirellulales bacterium]|nr:matrixin family metalloprotease [Pirellulales bacterium]